MIAEFTGAWYFLSNFYPCPVKYAGSLYPSSEHAYQAMKAPEGSKEREEIRNAPSAKTAKWLGRRIALPPGWEDQRIKIMTEIVRAKFAPDFMCAALLATGDEELQEGNWWGDRYWGISPAHSGNGRNELGKILMLVRDELRAASSK